jgi:hypothetical protein
MPVKPAGRRAGKASVFWTLYGLFVALSAVSMFFGLRYLWVVLEDYERSTQDYALRRYLAPGLNELPALFEGALPPGEFESREDKAGAIRDLLSRGDLVYRRSSRKSTDDAEVFIFRAGSADLAAVSLVKTEQGRFGRWTPRSVDYGSMPVFGSLRILAPSGAKVFVNGRVLPESMFEEERPYEELANLPENVKDAPAQRSFSITGLFRRPELKALDFSGNALRLEWSGGQAVFSPVCPEYEREAICRMVISDAKLYSLYTSRDATFGNLAGRIHRNAAIYRYLATIETVWYTNHTGTNFKDEVVRDIRKFSPSLLAADIDYTYQVFRSRREYAFPTKATFVYWRPEKRWLIADIIIR